MRLKAKPKNFYFQLSVVVISTLLSASLAFAFWFSYQLTESTKQLKLNETVALAKNMMPTLVHYLETNN